MDNRRSIAIVIAFIAAILVMMAGKSCSDNIIETNKNNPKKERATAATDMIPPPPMKQEEKADEKQEPVSEAPAVQDHIDVTNLLGDVVETIPITTEPPAEPLEEVTTREKSILEEYNERQESDSKLSGFSHSKKNNDSSDKQEDTEGASEPPTYPEDFIIVVN